MYHWHTFYKYAVLSTYIYNILILTQSFLLSDVNRKWIHVVLLKAHNHKSFFFFFLWFFASCKLIFCIYVFFYIKAYIIRQKCLYHLRYIAQMYDVWVCAKFITITCLKNYFLPLLLVHILFAPDLLRCAWMPASVRSDTGKKFQTEIINSI